MNTSDLRDMLAMRWLLHHPCSCEAAYEYADADLPELLKARETKWELFDKDGKSLGVINYGGGGMDRGEYVLPYKEPK